MLVTASVKVTCQQMSVLHCVSSSQVLNADAIGMSERVHTTLGMLQMQIQCLAVTGQTCVAPST